MIFCQYILHSFLYTFIRCKQGKAIQHNWHEIVRNLILDTAKGVGLLRTFSNFSYLYMYNSKNISLVSLVSLYTFFTNTMFFVCVHLLLLLIMWSTRE